MPVTTVCHISTFSPTQCGIATYTEDLIRHLSGIRSFKVRMIYDEEPQSGFAGFDSTVAIRNINTYDEAIVTIDNSKVDVVSLQHEFGIYGGNDGEYAVHLAEGIKKPIVTTLHTTPAELSTSRTKIVEKLSQKSKFVVVLTEESKEIVSSRFNVPQTKIRVISLTMAH